MAKQGRVPARLPHSSAPLLLPLQVRKHGAKLLASMVNGMDDKDDPHNLVALEAMSSLSKLLDHLEERDIQSMLLHIAIRIRPFFDSVREPGDRACALVLSKAARLMADGCLWGGQQGPGCAPWVLGDRRGPGLCRALPRNISLPSVVSVHSPNPSSITTSSTTARSDPSAGSCPQLLRCHPWGAPQPLQHRAVCGGSRGSPQPEQNHSQALPSPCPSCVPPRQAELDLARRPPSLSPQCPSGLLSLGLRCRQWLELGM